MSGLEATEVHLPKAVGFHKSIARLQDPRNPAHLVPRQPMDDSQFKQIIRSLNLKVTEQRMTILQCLYQGLNHVTAQEVHEASVDKDPSIGFATVYRFLKRLSEAKLVTEVRIGGLPARYELAMASRHHDHMTCTRCGRISEFENAQIEQLQEEVARSLGFRLTGHVLELFGLCEACQARVD